MTLEPFPWAQDGDTGLTDAKDKAIRAPLARPALAEVTMAEAGVTPSGANVVRRARVWKVATAPLLRNMERERRAALIAYADTAASLGGGRSCLDMSGGGGGGGFAGPNLRALIIAETWRKMQAALEGVAEIRHHGYEYRGNRRPDVARVPLIDLATWAAIDGLTGEAVLKRIGAKPRSPRAQDDLTRAMVDVEEKLAICCGLLIPPRADRKKRNAAGARI
ncbi:MAG: hypothetical protein AAFP13_14980 [Pseudomonadota bacterium]